MLDLLSAQARTTGDLCAAFPSLSRFAVMKHLRVLEDSGLLLTRKDGRQVWNHLNAVPLREVYERWVGGEASRLAGALLRLRDAAERAEPASAEPIATPSSASPAVLAKMEQVLDAPPGAAWPAIRTRASRDLSDATTPDDSTLEGTWTLRSTPEPTPPVRVRLHVAPEGTGTRVTLAASPIDGTPLQPPHSNPQPPASTAGLLAAAAAWIAA